MSFSKLAANCRDFCDFHKSVPCFYTISGRDFLSTPY